MKGIVTLICLQKTTSVRVQSVSWVAMDTAKYGVRFLPNSFAELLRHDEPIVIQEDALGYRWGCPLSYPLLKIGQCSNANTKGVNKKDETVAIGRCCFIFFLLSLNVLFQINQDFRAYSKLVALFRSPRCIVQSQRGHCIMHLNGPPKALNTSSVCLIELVPILWEFLVNAVIGFSILLHR